MHPDAKRMRRGDGFSNEFLGFGTLRDKLEAGTFTMGCRLSDYELYAMYYADDIAAKAINKRPAEMFRRGYKFTSKKNPTGAENLTKFAESEDLQLGKKILRGMQWGRWWGGALVVLGANDSPDLSKPLNAESAREIKFMNVVDRRYAGVHAYQDNPSLPRCGEPEVYTIGGANQTTLSFVHASRVLRFVGVEETDPVTVRQLGGWTYSYLQRPYNVVRSFAMQFKAVEHLVSDASQGVWKIGNLLDMIGSNREELMTRMMFSDMTRSAGRAIMVDAEVEDFTRVATSFQGLDSILDRTANRLAAALDYPSQLLMGQTPSGLNATGDAAFRAFYDSVEDNRTDVAKPALLQAGRVLSRGEIDDLDVEFPSLWQPTAAEKATTEKTVAETDKLYFDMGSVLPEQIAIARFGSGNGKIEIDEAALRASMDHELELMKDPEARAEKEAEAAALAAQTAGMKPGAAEGEGGEDEDEDEEEDPDAAPPKPAGE